MLGGGFAVYNWQKDEREGELSSKHESENSTRKGKTELSHKHN